MSYKRHRIRRFVIRTALGLCVLAVLAVLASVISNQFLPDGTDHPDMLSQTDMTIAKEALRVQAQYGDQVWPEFGSFGDGMLLFNDRYAFLLGVETPDAGFRTPPDMEQQGTDWEYVDGDPAGTPYHRQPVTRPDRAIGQFTARVGHHWVPSYYTRSESIIGLRRLIRENLPGPAAAIIPYQLLPMIWNTDWYIMGLLHESYHAYVGTRTPERLLRAERAVRIVDDQYPFDEPRSVESWKRELEHWALAIDATDDSEAVRQIRQALAERDRRRTTGAYDTGLITAMKEREWQEGLAKYTELTLWKLAAGNPDDQPLAAMRDIADFKSYQTYERRYAEEMRMLKRQYSHHGDTRFYYTGMAQAMLLDRLMPGWKGQVFDGDGYLEDLLRESVRANH